MTTPLWWLMLAIIATIILHAPVYADTAQCQQHNAQLLQELQLVDQLAGEYDRQTGKPALITLTSYLKTIASHEQALIDLYNQQLAVFTVLQSRYQQPDNAFTAFVDRMRELDSKAHQKPANNCLRDASPEQFNLQLIEQLSYDLTKTPTRFGEVRSTQETRQSVDQIMLDDWILADRAAESAGIERLRAEQSVSRWLATRQTAVQQLLQQLKPENLYNTAPACFQTAGSANNEMIFNPRFVTPLQQLLQRPVSYDVETLSRVATCSLGLQNPTQLRSLQQISGDFLERNSQPLPVRDDISRWMLASESLNSTRNYLTLLEMQQQRLMRIGQQTPDVRQQLERVRKTRTDVQRALSLREKQLAQSKPAAIDRHQEQRARISTLKHMITHQGFNRIAANLGTTPIQHMQALQQVEQQLGTAFIARPQTAEEQAQSTVTPYYLKSMANFAAFHKRQVEQFIATMENKPTLIWSVGVQSRDCSLRTTLKKQLDGFDQQCMNDQEKQRLNSWQKRLVASSTPAKATDKKPE